MATNMRFTGLHIQNYRQFNDFHLDLTNPHTGKPLERICLIGSNGTGKTSILQFFAHTLKHFGGADIVSNILRNESYPFPKIGVEIQTKSEHIISVTSGYPRDDDHPLDYVTQSIIKLENTGEASTIFNSVNSKDKAKLADSELSLLQKFKAQDNDHDLTILASPDGDNRLPYKDTVPRTHLDDALKLIERFPGYHEISHDTVVDFWKVLIYRVKVREKKFQEFLNKPETQSLSVGEARKVFDSQHPEFLTKLSEKWNPILNRANLFFDVENAKIPIHANENLIAFIKSNTTQENVSYNNLSTGIRNFIFRIGHIFSLYFGRDIQRGFLFLDEPEQSLFPDFLYDLIEHYESVIQNTQFFVATQSPIIASQFEPHERFILDFDENGYVTVRRGVSPIGDDPNDLLLNDFTVRSLYGKKGLEKWERFLELRTLIDETEDKKEKAALIKEYAQIGTAYNFAPNEISR